ICALDMDEPVRHQSLWRGGTALRLSFRNGWNDSVPDSRAAGCVEVDRIAKAVVHCPLAGIADADGTALSLQYDECDYYAGGVWKTEGSFGDALSPQRNSAEHIAENDSGEGS